MKTPQKSGFYLERMQYLLNILQNPEKKIPHYIHITGTSGKGSTTAYMHAILQQAGYSVGSSYSPHPSTIRERWRIGNRYMSEKEFVHIVEYIQPHLDTYLRTSPYDMPSFFELMEAIGFVWFAEQQLDWVVLEVGCGGRFDSSNVIPYKDIAIVTNIGLDHVGLIGNNKAEIAYEKSGIIRSGCHVITAEKNSNIFSIIKKESDKQHAKSIKKIATNDSTFLKEDIDGVSFSYKKNHYQLPIPGKHQTQNAAICIEAAQLLGIPYATIQAGLKKAYQPLRMELISKKPYIILDGAHNPDKMNSTVNTILHIQKQSKKFRHIHLIVGFSDDKQLTPMIRSLAKLQPRTIACTRNTVNPFRKVACPKHIQTLFNAHLQKTSIELFTDPNDAFTWSKKQQKKNDLLLVTGSIFLSGEIRAIVKRR